MANKPKLTWKDVYSDFKVHHPKLAKTCLGFEPHSYATILLIFPERVRMTYDYDTKKLTKLSLDYLERK